jgi:DNA-binding MarR family transcriptional regulator
MVGGMLRVTKPPIRKQMAGVLHVDWSQSPAQRSRLRLQIVYRFHKMLSDETRDMVRANATLSDVDELVSFLNTAHLLERRLFSVLTEEGLRSDTWRALHALSRGGGLSMSEIAESLSVPTTTTTRIVDELVDAGLVYRRPSLVDGRKAIVHLSRVGRARYGRVEAVVKARMLNGSASTG